MKKTIFIAAIMIFTMSITYCQNTYYVDNNAGNQADYHSLQTAIDSVDAGDILMLQGSGVNYGNITINKQITIIGPGYFLSKNPNTQANHLSAEIGVVAIYGNNTKISGCTITTYLTLQADDIVVTRNKIKYIRLHGSTNNLFISQNYIYGSSSDNSIYTDSGDHTNIVISNNIIYRSIEINSASNSVINNNIIGYGQSSYDGDCNARNSIIYNNIIYGNSYDLALGSTVYNNVFRISAPSDVNTNYGSGNVWGVDWSILFVGLSGNSDDGQWQLNESSPALGVGVGGTDCGAYGGDTPYRLSGIPAVPNIFELNVPSTGTINGGIEINIKAKAND